VTQIPDIHIDVKLRHRWACWLGIKLLTFAKLESRIDGRKPKEISVLESLTR
jgi:hypothetical protein